MLQQYMHQHPAQPLLPHISAHHQRQQHQVTTTLQAAGSGAGRGSKSASSGHCWQVMQHCSN
jgi:hypothetical protein